MKEDSCDGYKTDGEVGITFKFIRVKYRDIYTYIKAYIVMVNDDK